MSLYTPIQDILQEYHVDAMLVMSYFNLRYVTGGMGGGAALITKRGKYFFTDPRYIEDAQSRIREASIELCPPAHRCWQRSGSRRKRTASNGLALRKAACPLDNIRF